MKNDRKLVIYLICVGIATIFWFLNALNKEYTVELKFPVKYTNLPPNKVLVTPPPKELTLKVHAYGFTVLRHKLSISFSPLIFNVNEFTAKRMEKSSRSNFAIASKLFIDRFSGQISNEFKIIEIEPDTIYFKFDHVISKKVAVRPNLTCTFKKQHFLSARITTSPDSVTASGPKTIIDTLHFVSTAFQHYDLLEQTTQRNVLLDYSKNIVLQPQRVILKIPVEEYTEKQLEVPIQIDDLPQNTHVNLFPDKVQITFMIGLNYFSGVKPEDFKVTVSYQDIKNKTELLPLKLEEQPPHLFNVSLNPRKIEYLIEQ